MDSPLESWNCLISQASRFSTGHWSLVLLVAEPDRWAWCPGSTSVPNAAGTMMETWLLRNTCHGWVRTSVGWHHPCSFQQTVPRSQKRGPQWDVRWMGGDHRGKGMAREKGWEEGEAEGDSSEDQADLEQGELCVSLRFGFLRRFVGYVWRFTTHAPKDLVIMRPARIKSTTSWRRAKTVPFPGLNMSWHGIGRDRKRLCDLRVL